MANTVDSKLETLNNKRNAKVKEIKSLQQSLRKSGLKDVEVKSINDQIKILNADRLAIEAEYNNTKNVSQSAKDYTSLKSEIKTLTSNLESAQARGEDTVSINSALNSKKNEFNKIAPEVEKYFPELKTVEAKPIIGSGPTTGPDAARLGKSPLAGTSTVDTGAKKTPLPSSGGKTKPKPSTDSSTVFTEPMTIAGQVSTTPTATKMGIDDIFSKAASEFGAIDTIFKTIPELSTLMTQAVTEKWTAARWSSELQNTNWFKSNATDLQQRGFYKRQYTDLINAIPAGATDRQAQIDALDGSTTYGRGLASIKRLIQAEAIAEGAVIEDSALGTLAQDIYDHALEKDTLAIRNYVKAQIKYQPGKILSGKAGTDLASLKQTASANGLDIDKAFGSSLQGWLQKLAGGESVETYKNIIRQAAKAGLPERVGSLLDNGVDLETIYTPYKNILASTLEINPASITLNDPTLRSAIGADKEMSLYDYQRQLRQDPRWQYTNNARSETSSAVMKVLQDFGFKG
jgi:hypothetical protein